MRASEVSAPHRRHHFQRCPAPKTPRLPLPMYQNGCGCGESNCARQLLVMLQAQRLHPLPNLAIDPLPQGRPGAAVKTPRQDRGYAPRLRAGPANQDARPQRSGLEPTRANRPVAPPRHHPQYRANPRRRYQTAAASLPQTPTAGCFPASSHRQTISPAPVPWHLGFRPALIAASANGVR